MPDRHTFNECDKYGHRCHSTQRSEVTDLRTRKTLLTSDESKPRVDWRCRFRQSSLSRSTTAGRIDHGSRNTTVVTGRPSADNSATGHVLT